VLQDTEVLDDDSDVVAEIKVVSFCPFPTFHKQMVLSLFSGIAVDPNPNPYPNPNLPIA
jgi:hypothetical protein